MCEEAVEKQQLRSRFVGRLLPVSAVCFASLEEMKVLAAKVLPQHFPKGKR
jgi:hypothetical protein